MCESDAFKPGERLRLSRRAFGALTGAAGVTMLLQARGLRRGGDRGRRGNHHAGRDGRRLLRPPRERQSSRRHHVAGHLRLEASIPRDGRPAGWPKATPCWCPTRSIATSRVPWSARTKICSAAVQRLLPYMRNVTPERVVTDATAFAGWLDGQEAVDASKKIGVVGFCMSGSYTIRAAAALPDRVGAAASFHGAGVATAAPDSPHLLAPQTKAQFLFGIAQNDDAEDPESKNRLKEAFGDRAEVEVYPADHGWVPPDSPRYDEAQAEKAWARLLALFNGALA